MSCGYEISVSCILNGNRIVSRVSAGVKTHITSRDLNVCDVVHVEQFKILTRTQYFAATTVASSATKHPDYSRLAGRIYVTALHKDTEKSFTSWVAIYGSGR